jgi:hypothetical protein
LAKNGYESINRPKEAWEKGGVPTLVPNNTNTWNFEDLGRNSRKNTSKGFILLIGRESIYNWRFKGGIQRRKTSRKPRFEASMGVGRRSWCKIGFFFYIILLNPVMYSIITLYFSFIPMSS